MLYVSLSTPQKKKDKMKGFQISDIVKNKLILVNLASILIWLLFG